MVIKRDNTWGFANQRGAGSILGFVGGGPVTFLAGFNLATLVNVSGRATNEWHRVAIVLHATAVVSLLVTLLMIVTAQMYAATPDQRLSLHPEARVDLAKLQEERERQWKDYFLLVLFYKRVNWGLVIGMSATLLALTTVVLGDGVTWASVTVATLSGLALLVIWAWKAQRLELVFPSDSAVPEVELGDLSPALKRSLMPDADG